MKTLLTLLLTITITNLQAQTFVKNEVDEFTGKRIMIIDGGFIDVDSEDAQVRMYAAVQDDYKIVTLLSLSNEWQFLGEEYVYLLYDGERMRKKLHQVDSKLAGESMFLREVYFFHIEDDFLPGKLRARIGSLEMTFTTDALQSIHLLQEKTN